MLVSACKQDLAAFHTWQWVTLERREWVRKGSWQALFITLLLFGPGEFYPEKSTLANDRQSSDKSYDYWLFSPIGFTCSFIPGNYDSWLFLRIFIFQGVLNAPPILELLAWSRAILKRRNWNASEWWKKPGGVYRVPIYFLLLGLLCSEPNWMLLARPSVLTLFWLWFCHSQAPYRVCPV